MGVDIAKVYIDAEDRSGPAFSAFTQRLQSVGSSALQLRGTLTAIGTAAAGAFGLTAMVKAAVDAADELHKLSQRTGIAVSTLSGLSYAAKLSGVDTETFAKGIKGLSLHLVDASDSSSKAAKIFRALGVDIDAGPTVAFEQLAESLSRLRDGEVKTAVASEVLNKAGAAMIPMLNQGREGLRRAADEAQRLGLTLTSETAKSAEEFNDNLYALQASSKAFGLALFNELGPGLVNATAAMKEALIEGGKLKSLWVGLGAAGAFLFTDEMLSDAQRYRKQVREINDEIGNLRSAQQNAIEAPASWRLPQIDYEARIAELRRQLSALESDRRFRTELDIAMRGGYSDQATRAAQHGNVLPPNPESELRRILAEKEAAESAYSRQIALIEKLGALRKAESDASFDIQESRIRIQLEREEFFYQASLQGERQYITQKSDLRDEGARNQLAKLRSDLENEQQILREVQAVPVPNAAASDTQKKKIAEQEEKISKLKTQQVIAEQVLAAAEGRRYQDRYLADALHERRMQDLSREEAEYVLAIEKQTDEMRHEVSLIGESELAQRKANIAREEALKLEVRRQEIIRKIAELIDKQPAGWEGEMQALAEQLERLPELARRAIEARGGLLGEAATKNFALDLSRGISDALLSGGKDAIPRLRRVIEDAFKKPIGIAMQGMLNRGIESILNIPGFNLQQILQGPIGGAAGIGAGIGGIGAGLFGGGPRAGQVGTAAGAVLGATGWALGAQMGSLGGPIGMIIGAVLGAVIGHFSDPEGPAMRSGRFGNNPAGTARDNFGRGHSIFGTFGFSEGSWFGEDMRAPVGRFLHSLEQFENAIGGALSAAERARVRGSLANSSQRYGLGIEHGDVTLDEIFRDRMSAIVDAVLPGLGQLVRAFEGTQEETQAFVQSLLGLRDAAKNIDEMIVQISGTPAEIARMTVDRLKDQVTNAQDLFREALIGEDPRQIFQSEQQLAQAIIQRYNTEIQMVRQIEQAIRQLEQEAYQFSLNIAQRINAVGGNRDVGAIALDRAGVLRARIGGNSPLQSQVEDINAYVGAIDTWYEARRGAIERQIAAELEASRAIYQAQMSAAQSRLQQLQRELAITEQFRGIIERTRSMLDQMRFTSTNPLSGFGRLALATAEGDRLRGEYDSASAADRPTAANRYLDILNQRLELLMQMYDRSSPEFEAGYNAIISEITRVQGDAQTEAERSVDIQQQILDTQTQMQAYQAAIAAASVSADSRLTALDEEARGYYTWAESEGARLYALYQQQHREQLRAITGGMETELFIAARTEETVRELRGLRGDISVWLARMAANPNGGTNNANTPPPGGSTSQPNQEEEGKRVVIQVDGKTIAMALWPHVDQRIVANMTRYRRIAGTSD